MKSGPVAVPMKLADLMSVGEAARRTGISRRTLYKWVKSGKLWSVSVGGKIMVHANEISLLERKAS